ncbi:acyltransferase [Devosia oryziradicis]|uniref:Acyltransferase n=1 Tax=Devosia oryziradicis TaxID=2801335 RepID=A0ABX7BXG2_9HYPH|nr:acyltransferase [Devosia oryziradicis]QQR35292.1 acyltransferase [Devosia oryziradicis]
MNKLTDAQSTYLDCVRGISAVVVLVGHTLTALPWDSVVGTRFAVQRYAVVVFFILSGFLIAQKTMERVAQYSFTEYFVDRFARIFVAFVPALIFVAMVDNLLISPFHALAPDPLTPSTFIANLLMLHHTPFNRFFEWLPRFQPYGTGRPFWTIAVEWWLYMLFGIAFFARRMRGGEKLLAAILIIPAFAVVLYFTAWESIALVWFVGAGAGIAFTVASDKWRAIARPVAGMVGLLSLAALAFRAGRLWPAESFNALDLQLIIFTALVFLAGLAWVNDAPIARALIASRRFWVWLAAISYSLYLTHHTVLGAYVYLVGVKGWWDFAAICVISFVVAILFTWAFDRHHKKVAARLKRWVATRSGAQVPPPMTETV